MPRVGAADARVYSVFPMRDTFMQLLGGGDPRFRHYFAAKHAYEEYLRETATPFDQLTAEQIARAAHDERLAAAEVSYVEAIRLSQQKHALRDMGVGLQQLGFLFHLQGRFGEADACFRRALEIFQNAPQLTESIQSAESDCHYHLGILQLRLDNVAEAARMLERSAAIDREMGNYNGVALTEAALEKCFDSVLRESMPKWDKTKWDEQGHNVLDLDTLAHTPPPDGDAANARDGDATDAAARPTESTPFSSLQDVIWLLSCSVAANDLLMAELEQLGDQLGRELSVVRVAFADPAARSPDFNQLTATERLSAAILILEGASLADGEFRRWAKWCIRNVADKDDFRLFVFCHGTTMEEVSRLAGTHRDLFDDLQDTVQMTEALTAAQLRQQLASYLRSVARIRTAAIWAALPVRIGDLAGRVARLLEIGCAAALALVVVAGVLGGESSSLRRLQWLPLPAVAVISAAALFPLSATVLFFLFNGPAALKATFMSDAGVRWRLFLGLALAPAAIGLPLRMGAPPAWILLGLCSGVALETLRRAGWQARRTRTSLQVCKDAASDERPARWIRFLRRSPVNMTSCPLLPASRLNVFISYAHASPDEWSRRTAVDLGAQLKRAGVDCFIAHEAIEGGSSWRRQLNQSVVRANVHIALLDDTTVQREWVAAEMIAALHGNDLTGLPEILLLAQPSVLRKGDDELLPVFRVVLHQARSEHRRWQPRLVPVNEQTIQTVVSSLTPNRYRTASVFPLPVALLLRAAALPALAAGTLGALLGFAAAPFALLETWGKFSSSAVLASHGLLNPAYLLAGFCLGFVLRLGVGSFVELRRPNAASVGKTQLLGAAGLALVLGTWGRTVPGLVIGWALVLGLAGWALGASAIEGANRGTA